MKVEGILITVGLPHPSQLRPTKRVRSDDIVIYNGIVNVEARWADNRFLSGAEGVDVRLLLSYGFDSAQPPGWMLLSRPFNT